MRFAAFALFACFYHVAGLDSSYAPQDTQSTNPTTR
jgi:hypothetical protein